MSWRWLAAAVVAASLAAVVAFPRIGAEGALLQPDDPQVVAAGADLYAEHCAACHGANLEGQDNWRRRGTDGLLAAPPHDETGHTWHHADGDLFELTKRGPAALIGADYASAMPAFERVLSDGEIVAVLSYIKSRWPDEVRRRHDEVNASQQE